MAVAIPVVMRKQSARFAATLNSPPLTWMRHSRRLAEGDRAGIEPMDQGAEGQEVQGAAGADGQGGGHARVLMDRWARDCAWRWCMARGRRWPGDATERRAGSVDKVLTLHRCTIAAMPKPLHCTAMHAMHCNACNDAMIASLHRCTATMQRLQRCNGLTGWAGVSGGSSGARLTRSGAVQSGSRSASPTRRAGTGRQPMKQGLTDH